MAGVFVPQSTAKLKIDVALNADGNIAQTGQTAKGTKTVTINNFKQDGTLAQGKAILDAYLGTFAGASYDTLTAQRVVTSDGADA